MFISLTFYDSTNEFIIMSDYDVVVYIEIPHLQPIRNRTLDVEQMTCYYHNVSFQLIKIF